MSAPTVSQPTQTFTPTPENAGGMLFSSEQDQESQKPLDGHDTTALGHEALIGADAHPPARSEDDPSLVTTYSPGRIPGKRYFSKAPPKRSDHLPLVLSFEERMTIHPTTRAFLDCLGDTALNLPKGYAEHYAKYLESLGIPYDAQFTPIRPAETYTDQTEPKRYNRDHNDIYIPLEVSSYLESSKPAQLGELPGVEVTSMYGGVVRYIKAEHLRQAVLPNGESQSPEENAQAANRIAEMLSVFTDAPHKTVKVVSSSEDILHPTDWELAFAKAYGPTRNLHIEATSDTQNDLATRLHELPKRSSALQPTERALWGHRQKLVESMVTEPTQTLTIDYLHTVVPLVQELTGENYSLFDGTAINALIADAKDGPVDCVLTNDDYGRFYGLSLEERLRDAIASQRAQGVKLWPITFINGSVAEQTATNQPELRARSAETDFVTARIEADGTSTLVINNDTLFINHVKKLTSEKGLPENEYDEAFIPLLTDYLERYDRVEMWVSYKDFYHPQFCGWSDKIEALVKSRNERATEQPDILKKYEMVIMNRDLTKELETVGYERARAIVKSAEQAAQTAAVNTDGGTEEKAQPQIQETTEHTAAEQSELPTFEDLKRTINVLFCSSVFVMKALQAEEERKSFAKIIGGNEWTERALADA